VACAHAGAEVLSPCFAKQNVTACKIAPEYLKVKLEGSHIIVPNSTSSILKQ